MNPSGVPIRLLLADVDGTLVTQEKVLTERSIEAVRKVHEAGIVFAVTSGRPPRGMQMLIEPLQIDTPLAAFNGGLLVAPDMSPIAQRTIPVELVAPVLELLESFALSVWVYRDADWYVLDADGPHVAREAMTVQFSPTVLASFEGIDERIAKVVGVSDDHNAVQRAADAAQERFGERVSASRSQPYYLDVTHPQANKGCVVRELAAQYKVPTEAIATIGDMPNDVLMFAHSGLGIAMGNAGREVQRAARQVTRSNEEDGFAYAVERFVLGDR